MNNDTQVVDATVVENKSTSVEQKTPFQIITEQQVDLKLKLSAAKNNMDKLKQQFEDQKNHALKIEGAIEAGDLLLKSLSK
jgi:hypothetical protein